MKKLLKRLLRKNPRLFDLAKYGQMLLAKKDEAWRFFDAFSKAHRGQVTFLYIGANDGLHSDPIRYFIVRDRWQGVLIEPLPDVFSMLKRNYGYLTKSNLRFVNAAISSGHAEQLSFWTFDDRFLQALTLPDRINYLRKSSFDREHLIRFLRSEQQSENVLKEIRVPSLTLSDVVQTHWDAPPINLLFIDAEGHEASIIPSIDFQVLHPEAIYFEAHNLGSHKADVYSFLSRHAYSVTDVGGDAIALQTNSPVPWTPELRS